MPPHYHSHIITILIFLINITKHLFFTIIITKPRKEKLKTVLAIVASYFLLNLPYAVNLLAEYGVQLKSETR